MVGYILIKFAWKTMFFFLSKDHVQKFMFIFNERNIIKKNYSLFNFLFIFICETKLLTEEIILGVVIYK